MPDEAILIAQSKEEIFLLPKMAMIGVKILLCDGLVSKEGISVRSHSFQFEQIGNWCVWWYQRFASWNGTSWHVRARRSRWHLLSKVVQRSGKGSHAY